MKLFSIYLQGDSGRPLVHFGPKSMQSGILEFGHMNCGYNSSFLDVYISVSHFRDLIDHILATE